MSKPDPVNHGSPPKLPKRKCRIIITWKKHRNSKGSVTCYDGIASGEIHKTYLAHFLSKFAEQIEQREANDANKLFVKSFTFLIKDD